MAKTSIDRLVEALGVIDQIERAVARHERVMDRIATEQHEIVARLARIEGTLARLEADAKA